MTQFTNLDDLTVLHSRLLDALSDGTAVNSADFKWVDDDTREFARGSDAAKWASGHGLNDIASDNDIIAAIEDLADRGLIARSDSRRQSSVWYRLSPRLAEMGEQAQSVD